MKKPKFYIKDYIIPKPEQLPKPGRFCDCYNGVIVSSKGRVLDCPRCNIKEENERN